MNIIETILDFISGLFSGPKEEVVRKTLSDKGNAMLVDLEALKLQIYKDQAGLPTIGVGHLITSSDNMDEFKKGITRERAIELLIEDLVPVENTVNDSIAIQITQEQFDALVIFCFNVGNGGFRKSTVIQEINSGTSLPDIEEWWKVWNKVTINGVKQVSQGLVNRRAAEWDLYSKGVYYSRGG